MSERQSQLHQVLAEYIRRRDAGEQVDIESYCQAFPELADELRSYASGMGLLDGFAQSDDAASVESDASQLGDTARSNAGARTELRPNSNFGRYRVLRLLGEGAMGSIYLAEDTHLGRQVALKIPKFSGKEGEEFRLRFTREARAAAKLDHPNVCRVYDAGEFQGTPFITMEYLDGPPLSARIATGEITDQGQIVEIVRGIASGLVHAHEHGILHRDLKPGNVLMKGQSVPCITDFGLARFVDTETESKLTHEGSILGTPAYMAPEQIEGDADQLGPEADVYALGVVLYELLTGRIPFQGSTMAILAQALRDPPMPPSEYRQDVDPRLESLCLKMLEKDPSQRPSSVPAIVNWLTAWLDGHSPESLAIQAKTQQTLDRLEGMKTKILMLIKRGRFPQAIQGLEKLSKIDDPAATEYVTWAREKLPEIRQLPEQLKEDLPTLIAMAQELIDRHDYAQAAQVLQQIPPDFRSEEAEEILHEAIELQDECDLLLADLQDCVARKQFRGIEANLKRFLELRPGNKFARELSDALKSYSRVPPKRRKYRYDNRGQLVPLLEDNFLKTWLMWGTVCFAVVFGLMTWAITIYLKSGNRELAVMIDEDYLKSQGGELTLAVDGEEHTLSAGGLNITVALGEHGFSIKQGDTVVHSPEKFTIEKDGEKVLWIDASGMRLTNSPPDTSSITSDPVPGPEPIEITDTRTPLPDGPPGLAAEFSGHTNYINGVSFSPDGKLVATVSADKSIRVWDVASKSLKRQINVSESFADVVFMAQGRELLLSGGRSVLLQTDTGKVVREFRARSTIESCAVSPDESLIAGHARNHKCYVWEKNTGYLKQTVDVGLTSTFGLAAAFLDNRHIILTGPGAEADREPGELVEISSSKLVRNYPKSQNWTGLCRLSPEGKTFLTADWKGVLETAVDGSGEPKLFSCKNIISIGFLPDGRYIFGSTQNGTVHFWDRQTRKEVHVITHGKYGLHEVSASPDGRFLATAGGGVWDNASKGVVTDGDFVVRLWRLPKELWPQRDSSGDVASPSIQLNGLPLSPGISFQGTYKQQSPVATHEIAVKLKEQRGNTWHGEFESVQATPASGGGPTKTGFRYACELTIDSPSAATLRMTAITGNSSGNPIRDTTANWVEALQWDGKKLSNAVLALQPVSTSQNQPEGNTASQDSTQKSQDQAGLQSALKFDGTAWIEVPKLKYRGNAPLTLEAIVCPEKSHQQAVIANFEFSGFGLELGNDRRWNFAFHDSKNYKGASSDQAARMGEPVHVASVFDGKAVSIFINGIKQKEVTAIEGSHRNSKFHFFIGADPWRDGTPQRHWNGFIYAVRVSQSVRYSKDFPPPKTLTVDSASVAVFDMSNTITGNTLKDLTGNGYDAVVNGAKLGKAPIWNP